MNFINWITTKSLEVLYRNLWIDQKIISTLLTYKDYFRVVKYAQLFMRNKRIFFDFFEFQYSSF